jgi:hypothetical protein
VNPAPILNGRSFVSGKKMTEGESELRVALGRRHSFPKLTRFLNPQARLQEILSEFGGRVNSG